MRVLAGTVVAVVGVILAAGCGSSGKAPATTTNSGVSLASSPAQQVALARASEDLFSIFPARAGAKSCEIPAGAHILKPLVGTCYTRIRPGQTHEPTLVVSFTEQWNWPQCQSGEVCDLVRPYRHTWRVIEAPRLVGEGGPFRIAATEESGSTAPQYYK